MLTAHCLKVIFLNQRHEFNPDTKHNHTPIKLKSVL